MPDRVTLIIALIVERPMCEPCLMEKLRMADLSESLGVIRATLKLHDVLGRCRTCGESTRVLSLERLELSSGVR